MDVSFLKTGQQICIITKKNFRYEGILIKIDVETLNVVLSDVRIYGTENRAANVFIPIQECIYPSVVFESENINEIQFVAKLPPLVEDVKVIVRRLQSASHASSLQRNLSSICEQSPRLDSAYMWRIPRVHNFTGRSGDVNELPTDIFYIEESITSTAKGENKNENLGSSIQIVKIARKIVLTQGVIPKKHANSHATKSKAATTATTTDYNKTESFSDPSASTSISTTTNSNPNRREWNEETLGIPMRCHQRCKSRPAALKSLRFDDSTVLH